MLVRMLKVGDLKYLHCLQGLQSEVEMTAPQSTDCTDELERLDAAPKRQTGMVRSNSIVF